MMIRLVSVGVLVLEVLLASASDLPVTYGVQEKPLKTSGVAGTPLTFTLYSDNACTQQVYQAVVPIENVELISRLKRLTPKGGVKGPTTDQLQTTLTGLTTTGNVYLTVTGMGATPSGGACQVQSGRAGDHFAITPSVTIQTNGISFVTVRNGPPGFVGVNFSTTERDVTAQLSSLDPSLLHVCDVEVPVSNDPNFCGFGNTPCPRTTIVFGVTNCTDVPATCADSIQNQGESAVDCGGSHCPPCSDFSTCNVDTDCTSMHCLASNRGCNNFNAKICIPSHCFDGVKDNNESDVDCGAVCAIGCAVGQVCNGGVPCNGDCDCQSGHTCSVNCGVGVCQ